VASSTKAVIVDTIGVLAAVYRAADAVYVGGSFGRGVHNVMEPACFGLPVIFGPRHLNSYEALLMIQRGGAFPVEKGADIVEIAECLIKDESFLRQAGQSARAVVIENLGATGRTLEALSGRFSGVIGDLPG
jgi:3-deoxy-D-manno-octulosonic-acid transferase